MKKVITMIVAGLLVAALNVQPIAAASKAEKEVRFTSKVKQGIEKVGAGRDALVEVKLRDKTRIKGYVSEISEDGFVVTDFKTGAANTIAYADVSQVKGNNLSTGAKIAIGVSVAVGLVVLISWLVVSSRD
jgi:hypothetical protein